MFIGTQYYRPPFPDKKHWESDFGLIRDTGLDAVQLWACWGWIEPEPGSFRFDDYDELIQRAGEKGLKVIISTIAEIHPFWIHRVIPDSHMVDHMGNKVISSCRCECNVGLTPGGCFDNPAVKERMKIFINTIAQRYAGTKNLLGWDCWNETRWSVNSDGYVCYCEHTLREFRNWLKAKYTDLNGLNSAWKRRYVSWDDVLPGKMPHRTYTEMIEFQKFITWRSGRHMKFRHDEIKAFDKVHPVSAHCGTPSIIPITWGPEHPLSRGNDWDLADQLDYGFGCSHFPFWGTAYDRVGYGIRLEAIRSAVGNKTMWVSELQGGSARDGISVDYSVDGKSQQLWVWNGFGRGAKGVIFWCWRDEVFGCESSGFGLTGSDGLAKDRLTELKKTCLVLKKHDRLLDGYRPDFPKVGVLFEPDTYYLNWADKGNADKPMKSLIGYLSCLEKLQIPYQVVESNHLHDLPKLKLLIVPMPLIIQKKTGEAIKKFIAAGGTVLVEAELDAYDERGFYRLPDERDFSLSLGIKDQGRRMIEKETLEIKLDKKKFRLKPSFWVTEEPVLRKKTSQGQVISVGTFLGHAYHDTPYPAFEKFIYHLAEKSGALPDIKLKFTGEVSQVQWRTGMSGDKRLLFIANFGKDRTINIRGKVAFSAIKMKKNAWSVAVIGKGFSFSVLDG